MDGRHGVVPIMTHWECEDGMPYHPLVAQVRFNHGHMTKEQALEFAAFLVEAANNHHTLVATLKKEHEAVDWLMAQLIAKDPNFFPSKSRIWPAIKAGAAMLKQFGK